MQDYAELDALGIAERVRLGKVKPVEVVEAAIRRIEEHNPRLNAVVHGMYDAARRQAEGPLPDGPFTGVPFLVKDLDGFLAGEPYTASSRFLEGFVPERDAELISRFRRAGVVFLGKTNCPELGILGVTEPESRGPTRNPWDPERTPGGSSGGSAAAVAARMVPMAHGGDGGGSIRIPASCCGLFGLKPSRARNPLGPDLGEGWAGLVQGHVLTRSVRDSAAMLDATHGPDEGAPYAAPPPERPFSQELDREPGRLRIAFSTGSIYGREVHPDNVAAVRDAAKLCADLGHDVFEADLPVDRGEMARAYLVVVASGVAASVAEAGRWMGRPPTASGFEAPTWFLAQVGRSLSALDLHQAREANARAGRRLAAFFRSCDAFLDATLAHPPVRIGELALKGAERAGLALLRTLPARPLLHKALADLAEKSLEKTANTMIFNQTGQPAMSVPLHWNAAGLPIGVQFAARTGDEATLFRLAAQLERARPWAGRRPAGT